MIVFDLVQRAWRNMKIENEGLLKIYLDYKIKWEMLTADRLKVSQCAMDGDSIINKIIESEKESKVQFEHTHMREK